MSFRDDHRSALPFAAAAITAGAGVYAVARRRRPAWAPPEGAVRRAGPLAVRLSGKGRPVLLLHGMIGSGRFWGRAYDELAERHLLIVPDLLGFGRSEHPERGYRPDDHAAALAAALDDLGLDDPLTIGAHSLGCVVALRLAASHPGRVGGIVGFGPALFPDDAAARRRIGATGSMARLFVLPGNAGKAACQWVCDHRGVAAALARWTHPSLPAPLADDAVAHSWPSYSETMERCLLTGEPASWLPAVGVPVRLVAGDRDRVVDHAFLAGLARRHPHVSFERWPGDHRLPLTAPDRCRHAVGGATGDDVGIERAP